MHERSLTSQTKTFFCGSLFSLWICHSSKILWAHLVEYFVLDGTESCRIFFCSSPGTLRNRFMFDVKHKRSNQGQIWIRDCTHSFYTTKKSISQCNLLTKSIRVGCASVESMFLWDNKNANCYLLLLSNKNRCRFWKQHTPKHIFAAKHRFDWFWDRIS